MPCEPPVTIIVFCMPAFSMLPPGRLEGMSDREKSYRSSGVCLNAWGSNSFAPIRR